MRTTTLSTQDVLASMPELKEKAKPFLKMYPYSIQSSIIKLLVDRFNKLQKNKISTYHFVSVFEELMSYELSGEQLRSNGYFKLIDVDMGNEMMMTSSQLIAGSKGSIKVKKGFAN